MSKLSEKYVSVAFEKLAITHSDLNANINIFHFKPKILEAIDHLKNISHKRPDIDSIFDFLTRTTVSNVTKEALSDITTDLIKESVIINNKSINGHDSFRPNTIDTFSTTDETSDTDNTQQQNKKDHNDNNKSNSSLQRPAPPFNETCINTFCFSQQLVPEITTGITSLNTITEKSPTVPTNIQTPTATKNQNDTSNFTQKTILKIEAQFSLLKN